MFAHRCQLVKQELGLTLIEVMVSMVLSLLLLSILFDAYRAAKRSESWQLALYRLQDQGKAASAHLSTAIHQAGYIGCGKLTADFPLYAPSQYSISNENKLISYRENEMTLRYAAATHANVAVPMKNRHVIVTTTNVSFGRHDMLIIADCKSADIFAVAAVSIIKDKQKIFSMTPLHRQYNETAEIFHLENNTYFVAPTKRLDQENKVIYALWMQDGKGHQRELVEGVRNMQLTYTVYQNGKWVEVKSSAVHEWSKVKGVAITLDLAQGVLHKKWYVYAALR